MVLVYVTFKQTKVVHVRNRPHILFIKIDRQQQRPWKKRSSIFSSFDKFYCAFDFWARNSEVTMVNSHWVCAPHLSNQPTKIDVDITIYFAPFLIHISHISRPQIEIESKNEKKLRATTMNLHLEIMINQN